MLESKIMNYRSKPLGHPPSHILVYTLCIQLFIYLSYSTWDATYVFYDLDIFPDLFLNLKTLRQGFTKLFRLDLSLFCTPGKS